MASVLKAAAPLRLPVYRRLWLGQATSGLGTAIAEMALVFVVSRLTGSAADVGLIIFAMLLPPAVLGPWVGPLADRLHPHTLLVSADVWRAVMVLGMIAATLAGSADTLLALVVLEAVGTAFFSPARATLVTRVVPREMLPAAIGFSQSTPAVVAVAGPAIGGVLVAAVGPLPAFATDSATFVASAVWVLTVPRVAPGAHPSVRYRDLLVEGIQTVRRSRQLLGLIGYLGLLSLGLGALNATAPSLMLLTMHLNAGQFGALEAAQGLGGAAGPLLATAAVRILGGLGLLTWVTLALGALMAAVPHLLHVSWAAALGPSAWLYPWMAFGGCFVGLLTVTAQTRLLTSAPREMIGRVAALTQAGANVGNMAGLAGAAVFVPTLGISSVVQDGGLLLTALALALGAVGAVNRLRAGVGEGLSWRWGRFLRLAGTAGLPAPEQVVPDPAVAEALVDAAALAAAAWSERRAGLTGQAAVASPGRYTIPPGALSPEVVERLLGAAVAPGVELLARAAEGRLPADGGASSTAVALYAEVLALTESEWRRLVAAVADTLQAEGRRAARSDPRDDHLALYVVTLLSFPERAAEGENASRRIHPEGMEQNS